MIDLVILLFNDLAASSQTQIEKKCGVMGILCSLGRGRIAIIDGTLNSAQ